MSVIKLRFVTDYVCPFCIVAKEAIKQAMIETGIQVEFEYLPFQLTREPAARVDTWNDQVRRSHYVELFEPSKKLGLDAKFPPYVVPRPYSRLAFEGRYYAMDHGKEILYNEMMYKAYFIDEKDIGDIEVLGDIAASIGMIREDYMKALNEGIYSQRLIEDDTYTHEVLKISHVPTIFINGQEVNENPYTKEAAIDMLKKYASGTVDEDVENKGEAVGCTFC